MIGKSMWVSCDDSCSAEVILYGAEATVAQVRAEAKRYGWVTRGGLDLCPDHASRSE